jgi:hypothetical protein
LDVGKWLTFDGICPLPDGRGSFLWSKGVEAMPIIRVNAKQLEEANKARAAALLKNEQLRAHEEQRQRFVLEAMATKLKSEHIAADGKEQSL